MTKCKYYNRQMDSLLEYCKCFYNLEGCGAGGPLHILLDDDNIDDDDIVFCIQECQEHPDYYVRTLGLIICLAYLKMSMNERMVFDWYWCGHSLGCEHDGKCGECELLRSDDFDFQYDSDYIPVCPYGEPDCVCDPAYIKHNYPDWYEDLYGDITPEEAAQQCDEGRYPNCYDDEDK